MGVATLPPGKETRYPLYRGLGGHHDRSGWVPKILPIKGTRQKRPRQHVIKTQDGRACDAYAQCALLQTVCVMTLQTTDNQPLINLLFIVIII
jgi:hypothetical protein